MSRTRMPALFLGHGSPMNVLEDNRYTRAWAQLGRNPAASESDRGGLCALVYARYGRNGDGGAEDHS
ncbi:LigB family dioxygenase [Klebsiella pneumoniae subsp. pneumoniae]|uniref:LigB family dioxygenase n=1 Tax=Klebsiella pneumoniae subsp. pneumoniae TaxID=72407 RepID=A0A377Z333_KLEPN|nr:LigB family dioxygenase [Klebsiella pneumoniae subsp. pneumoniae]